MSATSSTPSDPLLPPGRWYPPNYTALLGLLRQASLHGHSAIFDWDNTCIHNDLGDAAFRWQLDRLHLALPPHVMAALWAGPIAQLEAAGLDPQHLRALLRDACRAWAQLWPAVVQGRGNAVRHGPAHMDFRAKLGLLYERLAHADGAAPQATAEVYGLLARLWGGLGEGAPAACVAALLHQQQHELPSEQVWTAASAGEAGLQSYAFDAGLRPFAEIRELMAAFSGRGVQVCVVSASFEPLVRALAAQWEYPVASEAIFGLRLALAEPPEALVPGALGRSLRRNYPITYRAGKVCCIKQMKLQHPIFVAGDALTDLEMLTHWPQLRVRLLLHRPTAAPAILALHREAGGAAPEDGPQTLLQGRNEVVGEFWPRQMSGPSPQR